MTTNKVVCLLPTLVPFLGVLFNVAARHLSKRASAALGSPLGLWVFALDHSPDQFGSFLARICQTNRISIREGQPARPVVMPVNQLETFEAAWLHVQNQSVLHGVPNQKRLVGWLRLGHRQACQLALVG